MTCTNFLPLILLLLIIGKPSVIQSASTPTSTAAEEPRVSSKWDTEWTHTATKKYQQSNQEKRIFWFKFNRSCGKKQSSCGNGRSCCEGLQCKYFMPFSSSRHCLAK
ncbi:uncharacterized protein LOC142341085 [Convolutriloba macropyga]|uniref:uncharacterized protein LOC142341085 n=1 Tax=Convolutriloba macropyga TaxID=536237 RepID=UPI003F51B6BF